MSRSSDEVGIALVKEACPICCKLMDGPIIIGKQFNKKTAKEVNEMNGKVVGFADKPCPECQKLIDEGCFFIIGVDGSKTTDPKNPYRSGHIVGITKECDFYKFLPEDSKKCDAILMDYRDMIKLKLINEA
jgi:hypothetical protein